MITFAYTILYVRDVERSLRFYEAAFGFRWKFLAPDNSYGEADTGATTLSFSTAALAKTNIRGGFAESSAGKPPFGFEVAFMTEDVESALQKARDAGATLLEPVAAKLWGQDVAFILDPDGFIVEICTPVREGQ